MNANIDYLGKGVGSGEVANMLMANGKMDPGSMRPFIDNKGNPMISVYTGGDRSALSSYKNYPVTNAVLRRDEWKQLDQAVLQISESRLGGIDDLVSSGLTYDLGNAMGTTVLEWHDVSDAMEADLTMDGVTKAKGDRPEYTTNYLPIPITHTDFEINSRVLASSRSLGNPLDTTSVERGTRKIKQKLETMLFANTAYAFGGGTIYGYNNHPDRNQVTLSDYGAWDDSATTAANILASVLAMKQAAINDYHFGPYKLYIPTLYETVLDEDYDTRTPGTTIRERILKIGGITDVKVIDTLAADNVMLVQMTSDVVRLVRGMPLQTVQWKTEGNFINKYKVMTIQVPQVRSDQEKHSGVVHMA